MSKRAWTYLWLVLLTGAGLAGWALSGYQNANPGWLVFTILTLLATGAQLFEAAHGRQSYYPHFVFFFAGVLLLHPALFVLLVLIPHLVEWAKARVSKSSHLRNWYIQPFNIAVHITSGISAYWVYNFTQSGVASDLRDLTPLVAAIAAVVTYVGVNHLAVGQVLVLARGISWKQSGVLALDSLLPDIIMSLLGFVVALLWSLNPWLVLPALSPLVLMYQALMVPQLKQEAQTDGKTGLWNASHFATLFTAEMERAKRFDRPLSVIMADLDLLRNINNTYGHLAGDTVLGGIGQIIAKNVREYDIAGRFGGEEFAICLPETDAAEAYAVAERLRQAVEAGSFQVSTSHTPIQVTMSIGIATFPADADEANSLVHEADIAVYQAKLNGRNCVVAASDVPHFIKLDSGAPVADRLTSPLKSTFIPRPNLVTGVIKAQNGEAPTGPTTGTPAPPESQGVVSASQTQEAVPQAIDAQPSGARSVEGQTSYSLPLVVATASGSPVSVAAPLPKNSDNHKDPDQQHPAPSTPTPSRMSTMAFHFFLGLVITAALLVTGVGILLGNPGPNLAVIGLLAAMAVIVELLQINVYGENTLSVSVAMAFTAALIAGLPGVAVVSAAIAIAHYIQMKPALYKTAFNWATHVLAGTAPVLAISLVPVPLRVENLPVLAVPTALAALAYYVIETGLIAAAIGFSKKLDVISTWRGQFGWLVNHYIVLCVMGLFLGIAYTALGALGVLVFSLPVLMMRYSQKQYVERTEHSTRALKRMNEQLSLANREVVEASKAMQSLNEELFLTLSKIIDARDPYVSGHAAKVADYASAIAVELGLPGHRLEPLRQAGFLHDIGKIGISEDVLHKPANLTPEEYEYVKKHARLGGEFLEMCPGLRNLAPFVRHHHERWDGKGYPDKLAGEEIPLEARILAVCDAAEAMASDRPYRKGMSLNELVAEVQRCAGTQFDPKVAVAFVKVVEREREQLVVNSAQAVARKRLDSGFLSTGPLAGKNGSYAKAG